MKKEILILTMLLAMSTVQLFAQLDLNSTSWFRKGPYCADVQSLAMAPSNPDVLYLGTYSAGIYKTIDGGENWTFCANENLPVYEDTISYSRSLPSWWYGDFYPINAIAVDPLDENHLWVSSLERGLLESSDGGNNWQQANETLPDTLALNLIDINPQDPDDIMVGTGGYFTVNSPDNRGVYRTLDGGNTWDLLDSLPNGGSYYVTDIARDPSVNDHIIIGISSAGEPVYAWGIMESYDNGVTWQEVMGDLSVFNISINPSNSQNIWWVGLTGYGERWLMFSNDGGQTWEINENFDIPYRYVMSMYADADFNLYIERQSDENTSLHNILKSEDEGETWFEVDKIKDKPSAVRSTTNLTNKCQAEPANTGNVYFGTYYGVYHSEDGGTTTQLKNEGLMNSYIYDIEFHPVNKNIVYAASKQGMWRSTDACRSWEKVLDKPVAYVRSNPLFPDTLYYVYADPMRSYDGGITYENIGQNIYGSISDLAINPIHTNIVFLATGPLVYRSTDFGDNWTPIFESLDSEQLSNIIIDPSVPENIYYGKNRSLDGGITWGQSVFDKKIIAVHPQNPDILFGSSSSGNDVQVSYDGGQSFQLLAIYQDGVFQKNNIKNFTISKDDPNYMFYCTSNDGIHYSSDAGVNWQQLEGGYEKRTLDVIPLVDENKYYVATHGDGVWVYDPTYVSVPAHSTPLKANNLLTVTPNPFSGPATIYYETNVSGHVNISIYNMQGKIVATLIDEHKPKGEHEIKWNGKDQNGKEVNPGIYIISLTTGKQTSNCRVIKNN